MNLPVLILLFVVLVSAGCSDDPDLPAARPLTTAPEVIAKLYAANPGHLTVVVARGITLTSEELERDILVNLYFPEQGGSYPLVLFSHGN